MTVADFAAARHLHPNALQKWSDYVRDDQHVLMTQPIKNVLGRPGILAWKGAADCPNAVVNSTDKEETLLTFKLPAKSFAMHPGPTNGVVLGWKSPVDATVKITGRLIDADHNGGDGIAWFLDQRRSGVVKELASGDIANGGAQKLSEGKAAVPLASVEVKSGDHLELLVLPKENHYCDTTIVELTIAKTDDSVVWNVTNDVVPDFHKGNPHPDSLGHADVWSFEDMAGSIRTKHTSANKGLLTGWHKAEADFSGGRIDRQKLEEAATEFQKTFSPSDSNSPFWIKQPSEEALLPAQHKDELAKLSKELQDLKANQPAPIPFAHGVQEGGVPDSPQAGIHDVRVHIRGSYAKLGDLTPRHFPQILGGNPSSTIKQGSGRLQLAQWLVKPDHPLTARVMINRIWQHHFGEGLVRTPSNFGKLGEKPSNPELLDYLAGQFIDGGWSIKKMHRAMLLSATYRQSSTPTPEALKMDADNRLFSRMNRQRLEAEAVRDSLLVVAGKLDLKLGGPAIADFSSPRRTLYQMTVRSDRSGFGPLFDVADSTAIVPKRVVSTVAPQALFLLNHPFVTEQTKAITKRIQVTRKDEKDQIEYAYLLLYGRLPTQEESKIAVDFLVHDAKDIDKANLLWQEYCQILLCTNEFMYLD
jgi:hypothetical protein